MKTDFHLLKQCFLQTARFIYYAFRSLYFMGNTKVCPCCRKRFRRFLSWGEREGALCPGCGSLERHRLFWLYLENETDLFSRPQRLLDFAPSYSLRHRFLQQSNIQYLSTDLLQEDVDIQMDITNILFKDNLFDVIICSHVLEHVPDDLAAMREIYRVLNPTGWALIQVPLDDTKDVTVEDPTVISPLQRKQVFGQEDHVRLYGKDFVARLEKAGFTVTVLDYAEKFSRQQRGLYGLEFDRDRKIYICSK